MPGIHKMFWILNILMWILFIFLKFSNPGFIATDVLAFEKASKMVNLFLHSSGLLAEVSLRLYIYSAGQQESRKCIFMFNAVFLTIG